MHDTAFRIGKLAMNIYADLSTASILEVGSQAINGSLRENALPTTRYVGLDIEEGEGVDIVAPPGELPVEDSSFDLVIASSVFEHDSAFWMTFLEMCRKTKDGGYIYINAPSNGCVHRYPQDNWRFYPDSGTALVKWAISQGQNVSLVESFIAGRSDDIWNDFVAVFRKGRITKKLPETFLHENVPATNILTWKSKEILNPQDTPEDMVLLDQARGQLKAVKASLADAVSARDSAAGEANEIRSKLDTLQNDLTSARQGLQEVERVRDELAHRESELRQRQEEIEQTRAELTQARAEQEALAEVKGELEARVEQLTAQIASRDQSFGVLSRKIETLESAIRKLAEARLVTEAASEKALQSARDKIAAAEAARREQQNAAHLAQSQMHIRFQEIATLTSLLRQQERRSEATVGHVDWMRAVHESLTSEPKWWSFMSRDWRLERERRRLKRHGLFDAEAYLERYPDVAAAGLDPLYHYMTHGFDEGRSKSD